MTSFEERCEKAYRIAMNSQKWSDAIESIIAAGLAEDPAEADELIRDGEDRAARRS